MNEKRIMAETDHPFCIRLIAAYKDRTHLYMVLEICQGGELFSLLQKERKLDEPASAFYGASVMLAFEYLHNRNIIYRDLKPENLLLDGKGYLKVVDFGFAKLIKDRTWTLCGTPEYLAPETIRNKGHGKGVDWWALGILIYEMMTGFPPFCGDTAMRRTSRSSRASSTSPRRCRAPPTTSSAASSTRRTRSASAACATAPSTCASTASSGRSTSKNCSSASCRCRTSRRSKIAWTRRTS